MIGAHETQIARRPHIDERVRPHAGHAVADHLRHFEIGEDRHLGVEDGVERRILRRLPAERIEQRLRLVQVVHDRRMPFQVELQPVGHRHLRVIDVAIVVVENVLAPVRRPRRAIVLVLFGQLVLVIPIDVPVAPIWLGSRRKHDDHVLANRIEQRAFFHGETVGQFHQHLRRTGLGGVQSTGEHVDWLGLGDDLPGLIGGKSARVGQLRQIAFVRVQIADDLFVGDRHHQALAAFIRGTGGQQLHALRCGGKRAVILAQLGNLGELLRSARRNTPGRPSWSAPPAPSEGGPPAGS